MVVEQSHQTSNNIDPALLAEQPKPARRKAPPRCSKCGSLEYNARVCSSWYYVFYSNWTNIDVLLWVSSEIRRNFARLAWVRGSLVKYVMPTCLRISFASARSLTESPLEPLSELASFSLLSCGNVQPVAISSRRFHERSPSPYSKTDAPGPGSASLGISLHCYRLLLVSINCCSACTTTFFVTDIH